MLRAMFIKPESQSHQTAQSVLKLAVSSGPLPTTISPMANLKRRQESPSSGSDSTPPAHHHFQTQLPLTNTFLSNPVPPLFEYSTSDQQQQLQSQEQQVLQHQQNLGLRSTVSDSSVPSISHQYQGQQTHPQSKILQHALSPPARQRQGHSHRNKRTRTAAPSMAGQQNYGNSSGQPSYNMYTTASSTYSGSPYTATTLGSSYPPVTGNPGAGGIISLVTEPPVSAPTILQPQMPHYQSYPPPELPPSQAPPFQIDEIESLDEQRRQRRRFQNRDAQKNFRERQKKEQQELVNRVTRLEGELQTRDADITLMRAQLNRAEQENEQLRRQLIMRSSDDLPSRYNARRRQEGEGEGGHDDE